MNLSQLYYYRALGRSGSYKKAAEEMFISQPTLSIAMSNLEKELGTTLIERKRKSIDFTEDGKEFYIAVCKMLSILEDSVDAIRTKKPSTTSTIKAGIVLSAQDATWSAIVRDFGRMTNYKSRIVLIQGDTVELLSQVEKGVLDLAICGTRNDVSANIVQLPAWTEGLSVVVANDDPLAKDPTKAATLNDLRGRTIYSYFKSSPLGPELLGYLEGKNLAVEHAAANEITLCSLVAASKGAVALCVDSWLSRSFPGVTYLSLEGAPKHFHRFWLSYLKNAPKDEMVQHLLRFIATYDFEKARE